MLKVDRAQYQEICERLTEDLNQKVPAEKKPPKKAATTGTFAFGDNRRGLCGVGQLGDAFCY